MKNRNLTTIGKNIRFYRRKLLMTQKDLAKQLKISRSTLTNIENGTHDFPISRIYKLCLILNVTSRRLIGK